MNNIKASQMVYRSSDRYIRSVEKNFPDDIYMRKYSKKQANKIKKISKLLEKNKLQKAWNEICDLDRSITNYEIPSTVYNWLFMRCITWL